MKQVIMEDVLRRINETVDIYDMTKEEEQKLRLLAEELVAMAKHFMEEEEAVFVIRKEPKCFALCYRAKAKLSREEKQEMIALSSKKENAKTKSMKGKMKQIADYLFGSPMAELIGSGTYESTLNYDMLWSMEDSKEAIPEGEWDGYEKAILSNYADDIIIGILGDEVEITVKMNLSEKNQ